MLEFHPSRLWEWQELWGKQFKQDTWMCLFDVWKNHPRGGLMIWWWFTMILCPIIHLKQIQGHSRKYVRQFGSNENPLTTFWPLLRNISRKCWSFPTYVLENCWLNSSWLPGPDRDLTHSNPKEKGLARGYWPLFRDRPKRLNIASKKNLGIQLQIFEACVRCEFPGM